MRRSSVLCTHKMPACFYALLLLAAYCKAKLLSEDSSKLNQKCSQWKGGCEDAILKKAKWGERDGGMPNNTGTGLNISHNMSYGVMNPNVKCLNHHQCTEEIGKEG